MDSTSEHTPDLIYSSGQDVDAVFNTFTSSLRLFMYFFNEIIAREACNFNED